MQVNLVMLRKNGTQKVIPLPSKVTVIGRRHDCDLRIPLMRVSKRHCQLNLDNGVLKIRDLGSRNGTILNGKIVKESDIEAGDSIEIGPLKFILQIDGEPNDFTKPKPEAKPLQKAKKEQDSGEDTRVIPTNKDEDFDSFLDDFDASEGGTEVSLDDLEL